jgi:23S rRNA pseudouridine1911/1915/1917 synthase
MEEVKVIYEDDSLIVLYKPAGIVTTNENSKINSLENWIKKNKENNLPRQGIVHRLDKGTSGIVVVAKTDESLTELKKQFKTRKVKKHYWALAGGDLPGNGSINMPINRSKYSFGRFKVDEEGKNAETEFKVVKKYKIEGRVYSLVDINLKTGRTHQIRVHMSYLGWPLLGDKIYGGKMIDGLDRPFLHAYELEILGKKFEAPMADDLKLVLKQYEEN